MNHILCVSISLLLAPRRLERIFFPPVDCVFNLDLFRGKEAEYSDEEESDTEEYKENRHKVMFQQPYFFRRTYESCGDDDDHDDVR